MSVFCADSSRFSAVTTTSSSVLEAAGACCCASAGFWIVATATRTDASASREYLFIAPPNRKCVIRPPRGDVKLYTAALYTGTAVKIKSGAVARPRHGGGGFCRAPLNTRADELERRFWTLIASDGTFSHCRRRRRHRSAPDPSTVQLHG